MPTHIDAYPHNCPGCINDPRPASDALLDEHGAAVVKLRAEAVAAPMIRYYAKFNGRQVGAIGRFHTISTTVEAEDLERAKLALYERYEHITSLRLIGCPCGGFLDGSDAYVHAESCERLPGIIAQATRG